MLDTEMTKKSSERNDKSRKTNDGDRGRKIEEERGRHRATKPESGGVETNVSR